MYVNPQQYTLLFHLWRYIITAHLHSSDVVRTAHFRLFAMSIFLVFHVFLRLIVFLLLPSEDLKRGCCRNKRQFPLRTNKGNLILMVAKCSYLCDSNTNKATPPTERHTQHQKTKTNTQSLSETNKQTVFLLART